MAMAENGIHISLKGEQVFDLFGLPITNTLLMSWMAIAILLAVGLFVGTSLKRKPGRLQVLFEMVFGFLLDYMEEVLESRSRARKLLPFIGTLFMFILLGNWLGLIPGIGSVTVTPPVEMHEALPTEAAVGDSDFHSEEETHHESAKVALLHPMSTDLNITLALAIMAFVVIEAIGIAEHGALKYGSKFVNFRSGIGFFVGLTDLFSELARLVSFSFRLFGNMFAGKTLIVVAMFFVPLLLPVPLMLYEVLVGFIQAAVFSMLTLFFVKIATAEAH
jgi:F-type H+-transporting ATPase subunit a